MRDRHTPRVLLRPDSNGKFSCPEAGCRQSAGRWTGPIVLKHVAVCPEVKRTGKLYCLTRAGTKVGKLSAKELQERRRASATRANARKKAAATATLSHDTEDSDVVPVAYLGARHSQMDQYICKETEQQPTGQEVQQGALTTREEDTGGCSTLPAAPAASDSKSRQADLSHIQIHLEELPEDCQTCYLVLLVRYFDACCVQGSSAQWLDADDADADCADWGL